MIAVRRALLTSTVAALAACAHPRQTMTFEEAGIFADGSTATATLPPTATPTPTSISTPTSTLAAFTDEELLDAETDAPPTPPVANPAPERVPTDPRGGAAIDATLLRFAADARTRRAAMPPARGFPASVRAAWEDLADDLERYLARPMPQTPLTELVRARVTVDAELDFDRRRFGEPPPALASALRDRMQRLGRRAEAARALGQVLFAPSAPPVLQWPIADAGLSSLFGPRRHPIDHVRRMHYGIDLAAATGRVVASAAKGFVVHAGFVAGYGLAVEVRHAGELTSRYAHLSRLLCAPGDAVDAGQPLGLVGATGRATGPHLHFEVWRGARAEDPLILLGVRAPAGSAGG